MATGILEVIPAPIATFDISDDNKLAENYKTCVEAIRSHMAKETDVKFTVTVEGKEATVPVTPKKNHTPSGMYVIEVTDGKKSLQLVATKFQAWFRGIVNNSGDRFEVDDKESKIMRKSDSLHTTGIFQGGISSVEVCLPHPGILATYGERLLSKDLVKENDSIGLFIVMLFEGPRFIPIYEISYDALLHMDKENTVGQDNSKLLIRNWGDLSKGFYHHVKGKMSFTLEGNTPENVRKAATTLRIMSRTEWDKWGGRVREWPEQQQQQVLGSFIKSEK
ncbi:hypothetical protein TRIUR3_34565 [Triticum urartu]|uniref:Uncharacterized protein n=1 Tax=Triticum urartu TaxID=4572 RepID=M8A7T0_TRIUA|nr:hypothetical protein TRIUR3_34565 [Triticum urartu]